MNYNCLMKKIAVFSHSSVLEVNRDLYYQLSAQFQADVRIVTPSSWKGDLIRNLECQQQQPCENLKVIKVPIHFSGNGSFFFYRDKLKKVLAHWEPDLIFIDEEPWSLNCLQVSLAFPKVAKLIYTKQNLRKRLPPPFGLIQKYNFKNASKCFSVSDEVTDVLKWKGFQKTIELLPHSFDPKRFHKLDPSEAQSTRQGLGIHKDALLIGYFGRLEPEKGILDLLSAIDRVKSKCDARQVHFLIVGNGSLSEPVETKAKTTDSVTYLPAIPHDLVGTTMGCIDVLSLPSKTARNWKEQFGRVLVEAMACGAATLGSDSGEIPRLIHRSGGGVTFPEGDPQELADCILKLLEQPKKLEQLKVNGNAYVHQYLTHAAVANKLGEVLQLENKTILA